MHGFPRLARSLVVLGAVVALLPVAASAQTSEQKKREVDQAAAEQRADLHASSAALARASEALQRIAIQLPAARRRASEAQAAVTVSRARHAELLAQASAARTVAAAAAAAVDAAEVRLAAVQGDLDGVVRAAYMAGPASGIAMVVESRSPQELADRSALVRIFAQHQRDLLSEVSAARAELAARRATLAERRRTAELRERTASAELARAERFAAEARDARRSVERQVAEQAAARRVAERERARDLARYRALEAESRRLARLIAAEQSRGKGRIGRGGLLWPTDGPVTSGYGYRTHPIYGYRRFHSGIDIGAPTGQSIVAVRSGTVVYAGRMGTYGNLVVIDHGDGFSTAYAHQSRIATADGARVRAGTVIGYVGSTGASTGPHLHYETRVNGEPVDPQQYY